MKSLTLSLTISLSVCLALPIVAVAQQIAPTLTPVFGLGFGCNEIVASDGIHSFGSTSCDNPAATTFSYTGDGIEADWSGDVGSTYISSCGVRNSDGSYSPFGEPILPFSCDGSWIVGGLNYIYHNGTFFNGSVGVDTRWYNVMSNPRGDAFVLGTTASGTVIAKFRGSDNHRVLIKSGVPGGSMARDKGGNIYLAEGNLLKKFAPNLSKLLYSRRFTSVSIKSMFTDAFNQLYLVGTTSSPLFRALYAPQPAFGGETDGFLIALTADGQRIIYSSFIGGTGGETAAGMSVDVDGNVFVAGTDLSFAWDGRPEPCDIGDANCSEGLYVARFSAFRNSRMPSKIDFGSRNIGTTTLKKILLTNLGNAPLAVSKVQLSNAEYTQTNTCSAPVAPDKTCTISVLFKPVSGGEHRGTIVVVSDSIRSPQKVRLMGSSH